MKKRTLIIGCGYIGLPLALRLMDEGQEVTGWVHSTESAAALAGHRFESIVVGSVGDPGIWDQVSASFDQAVHCASSSRGGEEAYREVFQEGVTLMTERHPKARKIFVSSTSVYGQTEGEMVNEDSPAEPMTATGRILRAAEEIALAGDTTVLRSSGIYGPGRGVLFAKFRRGEAVMEGNGSRWLNMIHRDDLVQALTHLLSLENSAPLYLASDDEPVMLRDFYAWCSALLGKPMPPSGPLDPQRKRGRTSKRLDNARLRATGWRPHYPTFREGFAFI